MRLEMLLAWRHVAFRPGKTLASIVGIAVGLATVVSVLVVDHNTLRTQESLLGLGDPESDLLIQPDLGSRGIDAARDALAAHPHLSGVSVFASGKLSLRVDGKARAGVELFAVDERAARHHHAYAVAPGGADLDFAAPVPELLVGSQVAERAGLSVGDMVELVRTVSRRAPELDCVDGELVPVPERAGAPRGNARAPAAAAQPVHAFRVVGILEPTRLGYGGSRVVSTFDQGLPTLGTRPAVRFWADFDKARIDLVTLRRDLSDGFQVDAPRRSMVGLAPEEAAFRSGVRFCGFLALFLGLYIIFNTMSMSLVERVRSIGLLRALGLTQGRLLIVFLFEGLMLAAAGAGLSLGLAYLITDFMESRGITTLGTGRPLVIEEIPWGPVVGVLVAGVVFCLLGVLYPFARAARLSVIDALRRGVIELSKDPLTGVRRSVMVGWLAVAALAWAVGAPSDEFIPGPLYRVLLVGFLVVGGAFALFLLVPRLLIGLTQALTRPFAGPAGRLCRSTLAAARHRVFATVTGLMLVFTAIFLILSVLESLKQETRVFGDEALAGRVFLTTTSEGAARLPELRGAADELSSLAPLDIEITSSFVVRALDPSALGGGSLADDDALRRAFREEPTILLSTRCASDFEKQPGDVVRLATRSAGFVDFRVLAVTDEYGYLPDDRVFGAISSDAMRDYWCLDSNILGDEFAAWAPGLDDARFAELGSLCVDILGAENVLAFRRGEDITEHYVAALDQDFAIFYAILALTMLLAAVGVLNAMVIAVMERRREIGLLRAVGLTGGQVATMLLLESFVLGLLGGLFGLALGIPLAVVTCDALTASSHLDLSFVLAPRALAAVLGGSVLISLLAVLLPALRAHRLRISEVMRYE